MISVDQISEDAYQDEGDGVSGAEDFQTDEDRGDEGVGGTSEYCGVAKCPTDHRRDPEDGTQDDSKGSADGEQWCHFAALKTDGKCKYSKQKLQNPVISVDRFSGKGSGDEIGSKTCVASAMAHKQQSCQWNGHDTNADQRI